MMIRPMVKVVVLKVADTIFCLLILGAMDVSISTSLRRANITLVFLGEKYWLARNHSLWEKRGIYITTVGTVIAVMTDKASSWLAYGYLALGVMMTMMNGAASRQLIITHGKSAIIDLQYLTSLCILSASVVMTYLDGGVKLELSWGVVISSVLGLMMTVTMTLAQARHSILTVNICGAARNSALAWCGMLGLLGEHSVMNFVGLQLVSIGCIIYLTARQD